jgi:hypothetical protein
MTTFTALSLVLLLTPAAEGSADVQLRLFGADEEQLAAVVEAWPEVEPLPADIGWDAPYPALLPLLSGGGVVLVVAVEAGPAGLAVSGRAVAAGGYDADLGTVHIAVEKTSLIEAVRGFHDQIAGMVGRGSGGSPGEAPSLSHREIAERLTGLAGWGVFSSEGATSVELRRRARQRAYEAAEADFFEGLEGTLYPEALLDADPYKRVVALVRGYLFVSREELRPGDRNYSVELRLTPEGVRLLSGLLYKELKRLQP